MEKLPSEFWNRAQRAQDQLTAQFINDPDVTLIDIGYDPGQDRSIENVVLRIHVGKRWIKAVEEDRTAFPKEVEGIPVVVIPGEYRLELD